MPHEYNIGDPVWAKMKGDRPWPAKITRPPPDVRRPAAAHKDVMYCVNFFGTGDYRWIDADFIQHYHEWANVLTPEKFAKKDRAFKKGLDEIGQYIKASGWETQFEYVMHPDFEEEEDEDEEEAKEEEEPQSDEESESYEEEENEMPRDRSRSQISNKQGKKLPQKKDQNLSPKKKKIESPWQLLAQRKSKPRDDSSDSSDTSYEPPSWSRGRSTEDPAWSSTSRKPRGRPPKRASNSKLSTDKLSNRRSSNK